jgi:cellulose synthase/poly-beta-1,6-N-acetylglucosamine synthase-like glycosyltransferase
MPLVLSLLTYATAAILLAFSLRRAVLLLAACLPSRLAYLHTHAPPHPYPHTPFLLILVPCRNEAASLPGLFDSLDRLDYPREQMRVVIVDDGSTDHTAAVARALVAARPWAQLFSLPVNVGKARALNEALTPDPHPNPSPFADPSTALRSAQDANRGGDTLPLSGRPELSGALRREVEGPTGVGGEVVVVIYDADHRPAPDSLRALVASFVEPRVAAVSGQMRVVNGAASPAAFYAMIESHVHQLITMRAKDRLDLAPAILGSNCAYRLSALQAVGGFRPGVLLEDSDLTLAFALAGWRTRFAPDSISGHHAPTSLHGYVRQHLRWNRGFHQIVGGRIASLWSNSQVQTWHAASLPLRLELTFFALGYADRLALITGALFTLVDFLRPGTFGFPLWAWLVYFGLPALEMIAALVIAREPPRMFLGLVYAPFFFALDIGIALWSNVETLARKPFAWTTTERADELTPNG